MKLDFGEYIQSLKNKQVAVFISHDRQLTSLRKYKKARSCYLKTLDFTSSFELLFTGTCIFFGSSTAVQCFSGCSICQFQCIKRRQRSHHPADSTDCTLCVCERRQNIESERGREGGKRERERNYRERGNRQEEKEGSRASLTLSQNQG